MGNEVSIANARAFVRSLNILLKFARLYSWNHNRTAEQAQSAWNDLRAVLRAGDPAGFLLGTAGGKLLLNATPVEVSVAEQAFTRTLIAAGLTCIQFSPQTTQGDFSCFVRTFASAGTRPANLAAQLHTELAEHGVAAIHINEVRFVAENVAAAETRTTAKMAGPPVGSPAGNRQVPPKDPEKLARPITLTAPDQADERNVLNLADLSSVPAQQVRSSVEELLARGNAEAAQAILRDYASCLSHPEPEARRQVAAGLQQLANFYAENDVDVLADAIHTTGARLTFERDEECTRLVSDAFVALVRAAAARRRYPAVLEALDSLDALEGQRLSLAQTLRPRVTIESHLTEYVEEALQLSKFPDRLADVLHRLPQAASELLAARFNRCTDRADRERLAELAAALGSVCRSHLRGILRASSPVEAAETVGLLSRLDIGSLLEFLPDRVREIDWNRATQDRIIRLLALAAAPARGALLLKMIHVLDPLVQPLAVDEIGLSGEAGAVPQLLRWAEGQLPELSTPYLRVVAIEALSRLRAQDAVPALQRLAARPIWRWPQPSEVRLVVVQALQKLDPGWAQDFIRRSGLDSAEVALAPLEIPSEVRWTRPRRHARIRLPQPIAATLRTTKERVRLEVKALSLIGGLARSEHHLAAGTPATLKLSVGLRPWRAQVIVRDVRGQHLGFEIVAMGLEERARLRHLLAGVAAAGQLPQTGNPLSH